MPKCLTVAQVREIHEHMLACLTVGDMRGMVKIDGLAHSVGCTSQVAIRASRDIGPRVHTSMASILLKRCSQSGGYGDEQCRFGPADFDRMDQEFGISKSRTQVHFGSSFSPALDKPLTL
jgi:hypothetical protein